MLGTRRDSIKHDHLTKHSTKSMNIITLNNKLLNISSDLKIDDDDSPTKIERLYNIKSNILSIMHLVDDILLE